MSAVAADFSLDMHGRLCVGAAPMFPVGFYEVPIAGMPTVPRESFNTIVNPYWAQGPRSTPQHLAAARTNGFFLIAGFPFENIRAKDMPYVERYVWAVKDDDRLLVWNLFEEPSGSHITVEQGELAYRTLRRLDRTRPVLFVDFEQKNIAAYRNCYDIFGYDTGRVDRPRRERHRGGGTGCAGLRWSVHRFIRSLRGASLQNHSRTGGTMNQSRVL
jgi:hypothetical protein